MQTKQQKDKVIFNLIRGSNKNIIFPESIRTAQKI